MAHPTQADISHLPKTHITTPSEFQSLMTLLSLPHETDHSQLVLPYTQPYISYGIRHSHPTPSDYKAFYPHYFLLRQLILSWKTRPSLLQPLLRPHLETLPVKDLEATQKLCRVMIDDSLPESVAAHDMAKPKEEWDVIDFMDRPMEDDWLPKDEWQFAEDLLRVAIGMRERGSVRNEEARRLWAAYGFDVDEVARYQVMA